MILELNEEEGTAVLSALEARIFQCRALADTCTSHGQFVAAANFTEQARRLSVVVLKIGAMR